MKKIPRYYDEIDLLFYSKPLEHVSPRVVKIPRTLSQVISRASEVDIRDVKKLHTQILPPS